MKQFSIGKKTSVEVQLTPFEFALVACVWILLDKFGSAGLRGSVRTLIQL